MSYYLTLISPHVKSLPSRIIKMLMESLVFPLYTYALPVWGPAIHQDSLSRISRLHNRSVRMTCKYDQVSFHRARLRWLPVSMFIRYRSLLTMFYNYYLSKGVALNPPILFGTQHSYETRQSKHCAGVVRCRQSFTQRFFWYQAATWWNSLPSILLTDSFSSSLYIITFMI